MLCYAMLCYAMLLRTGSTPLRSCVRAARAGGASTGRCRATRPTLVLGAALPLACLLRTVAVAHVRHRAAGQSRPASAATTAAASAGGGSARRRRPYTHLRRDLPELLSIPQARGAAAGQARAGVHADAILAIAARRALLVDARRRSLQELRRGRAAGAARAAAGAA
jgi:hypothetical protein